jgi:glutathione S-transferase
MLKIHGANVSPYVRKVRVYLAEKNIPYELIPVNPFAAGPEYRKLSPLGKIPAMQDGDVTLADSSVICAYLEKKNPQPPLFPVDPAEYGRALWFEEYGDGGVSTLTGVIFRQRVVMPLFFKQATDEAAVQACIEKDVPPIFDYLESQLGGNTTALVGGKFSIGDIGIATQFVNLRHAKFTVDASRWPKLAKYIANVHARPSFKAVIDEEEAMFKPKA